MHQILFRLGAALQDLPRELTALPRLRSWILWVILLRRGSGKGEGEGRERRGGGQDGDEGKGGERRGSGGRGREGKATTGGETLWICSPLEKFPSYATARQCGQRSDQLAGQYNCCSILVTVFSRHFHCTGHQLPSVFGDAPLRRFPLPNHNPNPNPNPIPKP